MPVTDTFLLCVTLDIVLHLIEKFSMLHAIMSHVTASARKSFVVVEKHGAGEAGDVGLNFGSVTDLLQYKLLHSKVTCKGFKYDTKMYSQSHSTPGSLPDQHK